MFYLGMAYSVGDGLAMNDEIAMRWIHAAASRELSMAQLVLGMKLAQGDGISKNLPLAIQWLRRASQKGSADAALQLRRYENLLSQDQNLHLFPTRCQQILPAFNKTSPIEFPPI